MRLIVSSRLYLNLILYLWENPNREKCYYRKQYNYRACCIADDTTITNSCIGPYTSIDKAVTVNDCEIDNCIILENAKIDGIHKRISGSLIGRKVQIKELHKRPFSHTFLLGDDSEIDL